jgi:glutathione synthase
MKIVAQMDEISSINIKTDSTFRILLEAQNKGHEVFYYTPNQLSFDVQSGAVKAAVKKLKLQDGNINFFAILENKECDLTEFDVVLVRQDPPFDMNYITTTYFLEKIKDRVLVLNDPTSIRDCSEKIFATDFPEICPPTLISYDVAQAKEFRKIHGDIVLKTIYSRGGEGVVLIKKDDLNLTSVFELLLKSYQAPVMIQKFLPDIKFGDKRIILVNGEAVGGIARIANNDIRSNLHVGGRAAKLELSKRDQEICEIIAPELKRRGLFFVGIDVIGDYLTEINVTSPTGIIELNALDGIKVEEIVIREIERMI